MKRSVLSILKTLVYADIFEYPLRENELWRYFIGHKTTLTAFRISLANLVAKKKVIQNHGFYILPGRQKNIPIRIQRHKIARRKMNQVYIAARFLRTIPTVWFVGLSGALAMENAPHDDDIDFFIICAPGLMWLTRFWCTFILDYYGLRRKPHTTIYKDKICLNMYVDGVRLAFPSHERDLYTAHEIAQLKPLINKHETHERFLAENKWALTFLPHAFSVLWVKSVSIPLWMKPLHLFEPFFRDLQLIYMKGKRTNEIITRYVLRFHPQDAREWVGETFKQRVHIL